MAIAKGKTAPVKGKTAKTKKNPKEKKIPFHHQPKAVVANALQVLGSLFSAFSNKTT